MEKEISRKFLHQAGDQSDVNKYLTGKTDQSFNLN